MNLFDLLQSPERQSRVGAQAMTHGTVIAADGPRYRITVAGIAYTADAAITDLRDGDRVWVIMGWGSPKIVGLLGPDQNAAP